jgi:hypothetical protein
MKVLNREWMRRNTNANEKEEAADLRSFRILNLGFSRVKKGPCRFAIHDLSYSRPFASIRG